MSKTQQPNQGNSFISGVIGLIVLVAIGFFIWKFAFSGNSNDNDTQANSSTEVTEDQAENFCQDAALLGKYLDISKVDIIDTANYNPTIVEVNKTDDGHSVYQLTWNGKVNDEETTFTCHVAKNDDGLELYNLAVNTQDLYIKPGYMEE